MAAIVDVDPYLPNAYSTSRNDEEFSKTGCRFDMAPPPKLEDLDKKNGERKTDEHLSALNLLSDELSLKKEAAKGWELDVRGLVSTKKWLNNYGLKRNKLDIHALMKTVGFQKRDDFDFTLRKPIPSKYSTGKGFVDNWKAQDGSTTNVAISKARMSQITAQLKQAIKLFRRRLEWLTTESRRVFGVIQEAMVIIVLDIKTMSPQQFDQYRCAVERVLKEQVSAVAKFNLFRATEESMAYKRELQPVNQKTIDEAIDWLWTLDRTAAVSQTSVCETVKKALDDQQAQGVYLFTYGNSSEGALELMLTNSRNEKKPLNIVSYNCTNSDVIKGLKNVCDITRGRFHAYGIVMELDNYEAVPVEENSNKAQVALRKRTIGGIPAGAGVREDVIKLFEEIEEATNNLGTIEKLSNNLPEAVKKDKEEKTPNSSKPGVTNHHLEEYMGSHQWININGLKIKKLTFNDLLGKIAFKHCDGVVRVQHKPKEEEYKTDANSTDKLINARYCDQFAHVKWVDGTVVHVQVTPETHRVYEEKVSGLLHKISSRIRWLQQGSRELFGTIIEKRLYILIDTSASMAPSIQFVKDKFFLLLQEQIRHKVAFNIITYGTKISPWRDRLVDVNEENLKAAWMFVKNLECDGSTNTLGAIRYALADSQTEGIYLLSDGRPDHPPKSVLAQVTLQKAVPIHAISFNCADAEANRFLYQMAKDTRGRYHYFSEHGLDLDGPEPYQSEDIRLLTEEFEKGEKYLTKVAGLRDECQELQWKRSAQAKFSRLLPQSSRYLNRPTSTRLRFSEDFARPYQSLPTSYSAPILHTGHHMATLNSYQRPQSARRPIKRAAHTRTSLLRNLSSSSASDWCLPETRSFMRNQFKPVRACSEPSSPVMEEPPAPQPRPKPKKKKPVKYLSSKNWMTKNSLKSQGLLIREAVEEACSKDDKNVHVTSELVHQLTSEERSSSYEHTCEDVLTNPYLEDVLFSYEDKLRTAREMYNERIDKVVWASLSKEEKETYYDEDSDENSKGPVSFSDNRSGLLKSLEKCGWPVTETEIGIIEEEIKRVDNFLSQSENIREAMKSYAVRPRKLIQKEATPRKSKSNVITDHLKGQRVIARNSDSGLYYSSNVLRSTGPHGCLVQFDDGTKQKIPKQFVVQTKGAVAVPTLVMGDYVLIMVKGPDDQPCYIPGQVMLTPKHSSSDGKFYEVLLYNGSKVSSLRSSMVKIGKARYVLSVGYIIERTDSGSDAEPQGSDTELQGSDQSENESDHENETARNMSEKYKDLHHLCQAIVDKQRQCKSRQKRIHLQMKRIHKDYQTIKEDREKPDITKKLTFSSLDNVDKGEEVLARWQDEGWYYRCTVYRRVSEKTYILKDSCGDYQQTSRGDIITDNDDNGSVQDGVHVIALHPNYYYSYAPGIIDEVFDDDSCSVMFYDGIQSIIEREELYVIDPETYERDIEYINKCEEEIVGQAAIARDNRTGVYRVCTIKSLAGRRVYNIEWSDGEKSKQTCVHLFGVYSKTHKFAAGDRCLSLADEKKCHFLPGVVETVSDSGMLETKSCNGKRCADIDPMKCFWLAENYYEAAVAYYNNRNKDKK